MADQSLLLSAASSAHPRRRRWMTLVASAALAVSAADIAMLAGIRSNTERPVLAALTAVIAGVLVLTRVLLYGGDRWIWGLLGAGVAAAVGAELCSAFAPAAPILGPLGSDDTLWLLAYPAWYAAIMLLGRRYLGGAHRSFWLDGLLVGLASSAYMTALFLGRLRSVAGEPWSRALLDVAYPSCALALVALLFATMLMIGRPSPQGVLLGLAMCTLLAAQTVRLTQLTGSGAVGDAVGLLDGLGLLLIGGAAWARPAPGRVLPVGGWWELTSPAALATLACGILTADHFAEIPTAAVTLAVATFLAALARLLWTLREVRSMALHRREALTDDLTGLPNRRALFRELDVLTAAGAHSSRRLALLQLDLDGFKELNDTLGHAAGDELLIGVARRLEDVVPATVARLGGDEFAAIVDDTHDAREVANAIVDALHRPLDVEGLGIAVSASIGIAHFPADADNAKELARRADVAMYDAKRLGTVVAGYTAERDGHSRDRLALATDLRFAFERDELWLAFQPQVEIATGRITGAEALIRWRHATQGDIAPGVLLPVAERTGLMPQLTLWVLDQAVAQAAQWRRTGLDIRVSVNVSAIVLVDSTLPERIAQTLARHALTPDNLVIEVTEDAVMRDPGRAIIILERLKAGGVEISVDDFGTGQSSLEQLKNLPADELKLDRSFVMSMDGDPHDAAIVGSVVGLGRALGLRVVAEGVETEPVWNALAALGCDVAQGFGLARPMPAAQFERWAREPSDRARQLVPALHTSRAAWRRHAA
jgi:diguanylate cyclase (GGDEF)-like protein